MKRFWMFLMVGVLTLSMVVPFAINTGAAAASGTTGDCTWTLDDNGVLTISGEGAMEDYSKESPAPWGTTITEVIIDDGVTAIGDRAFYYCSKLNAVTFSDSISSIGNSAFLGSTNLTSVYISDIEAWCNIKFNNPSSTPLAYASHLYLNDVLVTDLVIPEGVETIGAYAFHKYSALNSVTIPDSVTAIGWNAFGYSGLNSVTLGNGLTSIDAFAFYECSNLTAITIPHTVISINSPAFDYTDTLFVHEDSAGYNYAIKESIFYEMTVHECEDPIITPSTCTKSGTEAGICSICKKKYSNSLPFADHTFVDGSCTVCEVNEDIADIVRLLQYIDGHNTGMTDAEADTNGDGKVTIFDAVYLLQMIAEQ